MKTNDEKFWASKGFETCIVCHCLPALYDFLCWRCDSERVADEQSLNKPQKWQRVFSNARDQCG